MSDDLPDLDTDPECQAITIVLTATEALNVALGCAVKLGMDADAAVGLALENLMRPGEPEGDV